MTPKIDSMIGMDVYSTKFSGIGGKIRTSTEDFIVSEAISPKSKNSIKEDDGYSVYKLQKENIDTNHCLADIFRKKGIRLKSLGLKDAAAITEQYVCSVNKGKAIESFSTQKYSIKKIGFVKKPLSRKDMIGNHFKIGISECENRLSEFSEQDGVLNFYGYQRFGSKRPVTHLIGKAILQKDFDRVIELVLSYTSPFDSKENTEIRQKLSDKINFRKYFDQVPPQMDIERIVLKKMINSNNPVLAFKEIPLSLRRFYIQAYQSFLFNKTISMAFTDGEDLFTSQEGDVCYDAKGILGKHIQGLEQVLSIPFVGYSYYKKTRFDSQISGILKSEEISPKDFFIKEMQELSNEGGFRQAAINCDNFTTCGDVVEFTLSRGSFATVLLREIMKPSDPISAGF